jgi:predicted phage terminase large subunit-like protein
MIARRTAPRSLLRFIPHVTPSFTSPTHLAPLVDLFDRAARGEEIQATASLFPRSGKTETVKHAIVRYLLLNPSARVGYVSHSGKIASKKSREIRELFKRCGGHVDPDASSTSNWRTGVGEGGLWACGAGGGLSGEGFDLLVIDDPIADRARAESGTERETLWSWYTDVALLRMEPHGSIFVVHTRWHRYDLIARLIAQGWANVSLPAINLQGQALCPSRWPLEKLNRIRESIGEYSWQSLYQQNPFAKGGALFEGTFFYDAVPEGRANIRIGIDLAYSTKSRADYSAAVVLAEIGGVHYVLDVLRVQVAAPDFMSRLAALRDRFGGARACGFFGGTEKGTLDMMRKFGVHIDSRPATQDKFTRAQPVAAAWNAGKVLVPRTAPWLDTFVSEVVSFSGLNDPHDDQVDALAGAWDATVTRGSSYGPDFDKWRAEHTRRQIASIKPYVNPLFGYDNRNDDFFGDRHQQGESLAMQNAAALPGILAGMGFTGGR